MPTRNFHIHQPTRLHKAVISALALLTAASAHTQTANNTYVGTGDISQDSSWSDGVANNSNLNVINATAPWAIDSNAPSVSVGTGLYVGTGATGQLNMAFDAATLMGALNASPPSTDASPQLRVGDAGGNGALRLDMSQVPASGSGGWPIRFGAGSSALGVGMGAGSKGNATLLSTGKATTDATQGYKLAAIGSYDQNTLIGASGGEGQLTLDGAGLSVIGSIPTYFAVGEGAGSKGNVDVLSSGKLLAGKSTTSPSFIGKDSGTGTVTVHDDSNSTYPNQADFMSGLTVGTGGGTGTMEVLAGGKGFVTQQTQPQACEKAAPQLVISADGVSNGIIRAVGVGAQLLVSGKTSNEGILSGGVEPFITNDIGSVSIASGGTLVAGQDGVVKVGVSAVRVTTVSDPISGGKAASVFNSEFAGGLGPIDVAGTGKVVIGSDNPSTPIAPGTIDAYSINLNDSASQLVFNHNSTLNFAEPVLGAGEIVQMAGNTTITGSITPLQVPDPNKFVAHPQCTPPFLETPADPNDPASTPTPPTVIYPTTQNAFAGSLKVFGGRMTLPINNTLPNLKATSIADGTLFMGNTTQTLGNVTQTGGVLDLSGGDNSDVVHATSWNGTGGVVRLDTILGAGGNTSDVIHITGPITGTTTLLEIHVTGGTGALTAGNGIPVVLADTAPAAAASHFALKSVVSDNGFDYELKLVNGNWYLQSKAAAEPPPPPPGGAATPVPSLSAVGVMGLGSLLAAFAAPLVRRRKKASAAPPPRQ